MRPNIEAFPDPATWTLNRIVFYEAGGTCAIFDLGTAHVDFPAENARQLFRSICELLEQPPEARLFMCHDHPLPSTRSLLGDYCR